FEKSITGQRTDVNSPDYYVILCHKNSNTNNRSNIGDLTIKNGTNCMLYTINTGNVIVEKNTTLEVQGDVAIEKKVTTATDAGVGGNGGAVYVASGATMVMTENAIIGNSSAISAPTNANGNGCSATSSGGGVYIAPGGTLKFGSTNSTGSPIKWKGSIKGNYATTSGGGVYVAGSSESAADYTHVYMESGTITLNAPHDVALSGKSIFHIGGSAKVGSIYISDTNAKIEITKEFETSISDSSISIIISDTIANNTSLDYTLFSALEGVTLSEAVKKFKVENTGTAPNTQEWEITSDGKLQKKTSAP
ncbi:MAG: hypothetical protein IKI31_07770, partial [Treponema sp.]|nr:hypothetical protein [Treponema sp.]